VYDCFPPNFATGTSTDNCVLGSRGITVGKRAADDRLTGLRQEEKSFFCGVTHVLSVIVIIFSALPTCSVLFHRYLHQLAAPVSRARRYFH
jgi:hypothetical protein